jgi:hypothetical protein
VAEIGGVTPLDKIRLRAFSPVFTTVSVLRSHPAAMAEAAMMAIIRIIMYSLCQRCR